MRGIYTRPVSALSEYWYRKDDDTTQGLRSLSAVIGNNVRLLVEVGSADGGSICVFKEMYPEAQMIAVDPWYCNSNYGEEVFLGFLENVSKFNDVAFLRMASLDAASLFCENSLDFVYIDSIHTYEMVRADIGAWLPKVKKGGWIGGHDYSENFPGVIQAADEAATGSLYCFCDTSFLFRKPTL